MQHDLGPTRDNRSPPPVSPRRGRREVQYRSASWDRKAVPGQGRGKSLHGLRAALRKRPAIRSSEDVAEIAKHMGQVKVFSTLRTTPQQLRECCRLLTVERVAAGDAVYLHGSTGSAMHILMSGLVDLRVPQRVDAEGDETQEVTVGVVRPWQAFGQTALLRDERRPHSAVAAQKSEVLTLRRADFDEVRRMEFLSGQVSELASHPLRPRAPPDRLNVWRWAPGCHARR